MIIRTVIAIVEYLVASAIMLTLMLSYVQAQLAQQSLWSDVGPVIRALAAYH